MFYITPNRKKHISCSLLCTWEPSHHSITVCKGCGFLALDNTVLFETVFDLPFPTMLPLHEVEMVGMAELRWLQQHDDIHKLNSQNVMQHHKQGDSHHDCNGLLGFLQEFANEHEQGGQCQCQMNWPSKSHYFHPHPVLYTHQQLFFSGMAPFNVLAQVYMPHQIVTLWAFDMGALGDSMSLWTQEALVSQLKTLVSWRLRCTTASYFLSCVWVHSMQLKWCCRSFWRFWT